MMIGDSVTFFRIQRGMTAKELASKSGFDVSYIGLIENNQSNPTVKTMAKIAEALNVPLFLFFWHEDEWEKYDMELVEKLAAMLIVGKER